MFNLNRKIIINRKCKKNNVFLNKIFKYCKKNENLYSEKNLLKLEYKLNKLTEQKEYITDKIKILETIIEFYKN